MIRTAYPIVFAFLLGCSSQTRPTAGPFHRPPADADQRGAIQTPRPQQPDASPLPDTRLAGCWERVFGAAPGTGQSATPPLDPIPGCDGCEKLRAGPKALGLHPEALKRLRAIENDLPPPRVDEPVMWINSGKRDGPRNKSLHNQGLAVDLVICGLDTTKTAKHLRRAGFTCVIEYFDRDGHPCNMAHGDLRNTKWAKGAYAPGGRKSNTCPRKAKSKVSGCGNQFKKDWSYDSK